MCIARDKKIRQSNESSQRVYRKQMIEFWDEFSQF